MRDELRENSNALNDGGVVWVTGYSASGKTTVGRLVRDQLSSKGYNVIFLDGDDLRQIMSHKWGYTREERIELAKVYFRLSSHLSSQGAIVVIAAVAMYDEVRSWVHENISRTVEAYLDVPGDERRRRDSNTKRVYTDNDQLELTYDSPSNPHISVANCGGVSPKDAAHQIVTFFLSHSQYENSDYGRNKHWQSYYKSDVAPIGQSSFAELITVDFPKARCLLEVGCGNGRDAVFFAKLGIDVTALDISSAAIETCLEHHEGTSACFKTGSIDDLFSGVVERFDTIYSRFSLHAMTPSEEQVFIELAAQLLLPGGRLYIECRSINDPLAREGDVLSPTERLFGHYRRFIIPDEISRGVSDVGLAVVDISEVKGVAQLGDDDPVVIRLIAEKKLGSSKSE
jgi:bifunctional enzyme CysN/CysC